MRQVPIEGYVLIDPTSKKGRKMLEKWTDPTRPDRYVVPYTLIIPSVYLGRLLSASEVQEAIPLFVQAEMPLKVHIHAGIESQEAIELSKKILVRKGYFIFGIRCSLLHRYMGELWSGKPRQQTSF
jgi:hypothetical protein